MATPRREIFMRRLPGILALFIAMAIVFTLGSNRTIAQNTQTPASSPTAATSSTAATAAPNFPKPPVAPNGLYYHPSGILSLPRPADLVVTDQQESTIVPKSDQDASGVSVAFTDTNKLVVLQAGAQKL